MGVLGKFSKQPIEVQDYDIDFNDYLTSQSDTATSFVVSAETGVTIASSSLAAGVVKVFVSGGVDGSQYKISATVTTTGGRIKQADILIKVKEI
ncbi:hypothetical protein UFOVP1304_31 [uncultured Caudovirales phage]|uniref:Uncharacterized protein n=1 Tax=uncultured Caudovirales phage TaxID=2100421 RepID=A0A6J5RS86_9CAUD|nr:hypothetical protein UFOVP1304_31 [uncultured Caudovirales phage]